MIPEIGIVIAAYVITRMVDLFSEQVEFVGGAPTRKLRVLFSVLIVILLLATIVITGFVGVDLALRALTGGAGNPAGDLNPIR